MLTASEIDLLTQNNHNLVLSLVIQHLSSSGINKNIINEILKSFNHSTNISNNQLQTHSNQLLGNPSQLTQIINQYSKLSLKITNKQKILKYSQQQELKEFTFFKNLITNQHLNTFNRTSFIRSIGKNFTSKYSAQSEDTFLPFCINHYKKMKSVFGHASKEENLENEDDVTSPVYNLLYDKTGNLLISAADDGLIKIWSKHNMMLLNTMKGHSRPINHVEVSSCNKYIASSSDDGTVRIWSLKTFEPVAVLKDWNSVVCYNVFFEIEDTNKEKSMALVCALEDVNTLYIYHEHDFAKNRGIRLPNQKLYQLTYEESQGKQGFSSLSRHPQGYLTAGTNEGEIIVWDKLGNIIDNLSNGSNQEIRKIIFKGHINECHLAVWNSDGSKLVTASKDGTARIWDWKSNSDFTVNHLRNSIFTLKCPDLANKEALCCAVNWSKKGTYCFASFVASEIRRNRRRNQDQPTKKYAFIQFYDSTKNQLMHNVEILLDEDPQLDNCIYVLEPHPQIERIVLTGEYSGRVSLWDVVLGRQLKVFWERGVHLYTPNLNLAILDGRFSPDGNSFCVATLYGAISLYSCDERDFYTATPSEQFFRNDYDAFQLEDGTFRTHDLKTETECHLVDKPSISTLEGTIYEYQPNILRESRAIQKFVFNDQSEQQQQQQEIQTAVKKESLLALDQQFKTRLLKGEKREQLYFEDFNYQDVVQMEQTYKNLEEIDKIINQKKQAKQSIVQQQAQKPQKIEEKQKNNYQLEVNRLQQQQQQSQEQIPQRQRQLRRLTRISQSSEGSDDIKDDQQIELEQIQQEKQQLQGSSQSEQESESEEDLSIQENQKSYIESENDSNFELDANSDSNITPLTRNQTRYGARRKLVDTLDDDEYSFNDKISSDREIYQTRRTYQTKQQYQYQQQQQQQQQIKKEKEKEKVQYPPVIITLYKNKFDDTYSFSKVPLTKRQIRFESDSICEEDVNISTVPQQTNRRQTRSMLTKRKAGNDMQIDAEVRNSLVRLRAKRNSQQNTEQIHNDEKTLEGKICQRCYQENAKKKCSQASCNKYYHEYCSKKRGLIKDERFYCFECIFNRRKSQNQSKEIDFNRINREWLMATTQNDFEYIPQVGDYVTYFFQGHEDFLGKYFNILDFENSNDILPVNYYQQLLQPTNCKIINVKYKFPRLTNVKQFENLDFCSIITELSLTIIDDPNIEFQIQFFRSNLPDFICLTYYLNIKRQTIYPLLKEPKIFILNRFDGIKEKVQILEISYKDEGFPNTNWQSIKVRPINEQGYSLRRNLRKFNKNEDEIEGIVEEDERINYWQLSIDNQPLPNEVIQEQEKNRICENFNRFIQNNKDICESFIDEVDSTLYYDYGIIVPLQMYLKRILSRLQNNFYRRKEALISDVNQIEKNSFLYNVPESKICQNATQLIQKLTEIIENRETEETYRPLLIRRSMKNVFQKLEENILDTLEEEFNYEDQQEIEQEEQKYEDENQEQQEIQEEDEEEEVEEEEEEIEEDENKYELYYEQEDSQQKILIEQGIDQNKLLNGSLQNISLSKQLVENSNNNNNNNQKNNVLQKNSIKTRLRNQRNQPQKYNQLFTQENPISSNNSINNKRITRSSYNQSPKIKLNKQQQYDEDELEQQPLNELDDEYYQEDSSNGFSANVSNHRYNTRKRQNKQYAPNKNSQSLRPTRSIFKNKKI